MTVVHSLCRNQRIRQTLGAGRGNRRLKSEALVSEANRLRHRECLRLALDHLAAAGPPLLLLPNAPWASGILAVLLVVVTFTTRRLEPSLQNVLLPFAVPTRWRTARAQQQAPSALRSLRSEGRSGSFPTSPEVIDWNAEAPRIDPLSDDGIARLIESRSQA